jgi:hypothetical protein
MQTLFNYPGIDGMHKREVELLQLASLHALSNGLNISNVSSS